MTWRATTIVLAAALIAAGAIAVQGPAAAQDVSSVERVGKTGPSGSDPGFRKQRAAASDAVPVIEPHGPAARRAGEGVFLLKDVRFTGNTQIASADIGHITQAYTGRMVAIEDLSRMRDEITQLYVSRGYVSSGARLPAQSADDGVIDVEIVEGKIAHVRVEGASSLSDSYVTSRFDVHEGDIVNLRAFESRFRTLLDDAALSQIDADLRPGKEPGEADIVLKVREADRFALQVNYANERSPSIGGDRGSVEAFIRNTLFDADYLTLETGLTQGLYDGRFSYAVPLSADGLAFSVSADYSHAKAIEEPLTALDILSESVSSRAGVTYPLLTENDAAQSLKLVVSAAVDFQHSETFLGGVPFPFSPGSVDGTTEYWSSIFGAQLSVRSSETVFVVGADLKLGLDALTPPVASSANPDPNYWLLSSQIQYSRVLNKNGLLVNLHVDGQYTDGPMFVSEKFAAGGLESVRGFRKNRALGDFGVRGSVEITQPLLATGLAGAGKRDLAVFGFFDAAQLWNGGDAAPDISHLSGIGGGVNWTPAEWFGARLSWAERLDDVPAPSEKTLQDNGLYFQLTFRPLDVQ